MSENKTQNAGKVQQQDVRKARLAQALRQNLRRRKDQDRARQDNSDQDCSDGDDM